MKKYLIWIACATIGIVSSCLTASAAVFDIVGFNGWTDGWGSGTPDYATDVLTGGATPLSGSAVLMYDHVDGDPGRGVDHLFASPLTNQVEIKFNLYIPGANEGAFFVAYYMTDASDADVTSWGGAYMQSGGCWIEEWNFGVTGPSLVRDAWQEIKMAFDFDAGTAQYFTNGVAVGSPASITATKISGFGYPFQESYMGTAFTGPVYFDNFSVVHNGTTIWSENFDSYISAGGDANLISIDVVANGSVAVSDDVAGGLTGQSGLWNALPLDGSTITLSTLTDGAGTTASGVSFVFDSASVGYHVQQADAPYNPGVVLAADNPERSWVTGGESPVTFKFTGLTVGGNYSLAIFTTGDPLMTLTVNGTPTLNPGEIFTTTAAADGSGEIVMQVSCGGDTYSNYGEIAGLQLLKLVAPPALAAHAGADLALSPSSPSGTLGASTAATGGTGPYTYAWTPTTGLDDATLAHSTVTTTAATTTYTLTVTDSLLATASDTVVVTYTVPALVANAGPDVSVSECSPAQIGGSPTASGGTPGYTYSWTPTTGLSSTTVANPTASPTTTTTYTVTVTDSASTTASASVVVTYAVPSLIGSAATLDTASSPLTLDYAFIYGTHQDVWTSFKLTTVGSGDTSMTMQDADPDGGNAGSYPPTIHTSVNSSGYYGLSGNDYAQGNGYHPTANASSVTPVAGDVIYVKMHLNAPYDDFYDKKTISLWVNPADTSSEAALGTPAVTYNHLPWPYGRQGYQKLSVSGNAQLTNVLVGADICSARQAAALPPPEAPTNLTATAGNATVGLGWDAVTNATAGYLVKRSLSNGSYAYLDSTANANATNYTDNAVSNGVLYWYVVSATNQWGESSNSAPVSARPLPAVAPTPELLTGSGVNSGYSLDPASGEVRLQFTGMGGIKYWLVYKDDLLDSTWHPLVETETTCTNNGTGPMTLIYTNAPDVTQRFYRVEAQLPSP